MSRLLLFLSAVSIVACGGGGTLTTNSTDEVPDSGAQTEDSGSLLVDSGTPDVDTGTDAGVDMAEPVELQHTLYVIEQDGTIRWYSLDNPAVPEPLGSTDVGGRVTYGAFDQGAQRLFINNEMRVEGFSIAGLEPVALGAGSMSVGGTALAVTRDGQAVVTASYGGDTIVLNPLQDGVPQDSTQELGGAGSGFCDRAHQVRTHPAGRFIYVPCLANDAVRILEWDSGSLSDVGVASTAPGMGPRHMTFHPTLDVAYVLGESNSTVEVFDVDTAGGTLSRRQTVSTMANDSGASASSDIHVSADGRFVYAMNRQPIYDLAAFEVDPATGELSRLENVASGGEHARTFVLHPDGGHLYAGHSDTRNVSIFTLGDDGRPSLIANGLGPFDAPVWYVGIHTREVQ